MYIHVCITLEFMHTHTHTNRPRISHNTQINSNQFMQSSNEKKNGNEWDCFCFEVLNFRLLSLCMCKRDETYNRECEDSFYELSFGQRFNVNAKLTQHNCGMLYWQCRNWIVYLFIFFTSVFSLLLLLLLLAYSLAFVVYVCTFFGRVTDPRQSFFCFVLVALLFCPFMHT